MLEQGTVQYCVLPRKKEEKEVLEKTSASKAGSAAEKAAEAKIRDLKRIRKTVNAIIDKLSDEEGYSGLV